MADALAPVAPRRTNDAAVAGLTLAATGLIPLWGAPCALLGAIFSAVGMRRRDGSGRRVAVAGLTVAVTLILWQVLGFLWLVSTVGRFD